MKPGQDSRPSVPAATPKSEAVSARMFETVCGDVHISIMQGRSARAGPREGAEEMGWLWKITYPCIVLHALGHYWVRSQLLLI